MKTLKLYESWLNEKSSQETEKIVYNPETITDSFKSILDKLVNILSNKTKLEVVYSPVIENFKQNDSKEFFGVRFITSNAYIFRLNWERKELGLSNIHSIDFWKDEDNHVPTFKLEVENPSMVKIVSTIVEVLDKSGVPEKISIEDIILNTLDVEDSVNESLEGEELEEFKALNKKYVIEGADSLSQEERKRLVYLQATKIGYRDVAEALNSVKVKEVSSEVSLDNEEDEKIERLIQRLNDNSEDVQTKFKNMEVMITSTVLGNTNALIITGTAGIGKTEALFSVMDRFGYKVDEDYRLITGSSTAYGAYREFFMYRDDKLMVFDDCDDLFKDTTSINLLKGVLNTKKRRLVSWVSNNTFSRKDKTEEEIQALLKKGKIPNSFEFTSSVIFITNITREDIMENKNLQAIISRASIVDITLDEEELIERLKFLIDKIDVGIPEEEKWEIYNVMKSAYESGALDGKLDIRTFVKMVGAKKTANYFKGSDMEVDWVKLAVNHS